MPSVLFQCEVVCHLGGGERDGTGGDARVDASPAVKENPDFVGGSVKWSGVSRFIESKVRSLVGFVHESKKIKKILIEQKTKE